MELLALHFYHLFTQGFFSPHNKQRSCCREFPSIQGNQLLCSTEALSAQANPLVSYTNNILDLPKGGPIGFIIIISLLLLLPPLYCLILRTQHEPTWLSQGLKFGKPWGRQVFNESSKGQPRLSNDIKVDKEGPVEMVYYTVGQTEMKTRKWPTQTLESDSMLIQGTVHLLHHFASSNS